MVCWCQSKRVSRKKVTEVIFPVSPNRTVTEMLRGLKGKKKKKKLKEVQEMRQKIRDFEK